MPRRALTAFLVLALTSCAPGTSPAPAPAPPADRSDPRPPTPTETRAPVPESAPETWQNGDLELDGVPGTSTDRALEELLADRQPGRAVVVAVIDGGVDTAHVDLRDALWRNPQETPGNDRDEDGNGYIDDVHGWNFIGGPDGRNVEHATLEITRLHARCLRGEEIPRYECAEVAEGYAEEQSDAAQLATQVEQVGTALQAITMMLRQATGTDSLTEATVEAVQSTDGRLMQARDLWLQLDDAGITLDYMEEVDEEIASQKEYGLNLDFENRVIVGDDLEDGAQRVYGNPDVTGPDASHGSHVAGIIGASRGNGVGIDGVASPNVRIMAVRTTPNGDERDKDVANGIRYAVDQGADIINMSFGKSWSPRKELVDAAVRYADEQGVLMIHAAGNDGEDLDAEDGFPSPEYLDGGRAENWITVGASTWKVDSLAAPFTNYGRERVDVFAPGVDILSTVPGGEFERQDGTSMAAPVVSGVAALLMAYFPELDAADVKRIILETATPYDDRRVPPPGDPAPPVLFGSLSVTGGVVNAYEAVRRALELDHARE